MSTPFSIGFFFSFSALPSSAQRTLPMRLSLRPFSFPRLLSPCRSSSLFLPPTSLRHLSTTSLPAFIHHPPSIPPPLQKLLTFLTYVPLLLFFQTHVATLMTVTGASMYPLLNTDYDRTTARDVVLVDLWRPGAGLRRGVVVAFW